MGKDCFLKRLDLVLQLHEVRYRLIPGNVRRIRMNLVIYSPLVRVIGALQVDILLVPKQAIEFRPELVKSKLGQKKLYVSADKRTVPYATCENGIDHGEEKAPLPPLWPIVREHVSSHPV